MMSYVFPLLAVTVLCGFWAIFQIWLSKHDADTETRSLKCGGCGRRGECD